MDKIKNETRDIGDDELGKQISNAISQLDVLPEAASLMAIFSSYIPSENALVCSHTLNNPETVATALVNEAMLFGRQKEVLEFIRAAKSILDTAEQNIEHYINIQRMNN